MTDLERRLKRAKDATADAGASSEHSETDLERRLRIAHEEKKQYTRSGEYRRNALQNRTESFMDIVTQGETAARAGIDRYKANRDADYYQQMNKAGATYRDQDMINRSVTGYKGAYDLWKSAFDREKDAAADRTRREREMTENPAKAPTVSDIVSRYSGKTKTLADLGNNVRGAIDAYKRQSDAAKAAPTPEEARQQAEESVQYWQNVAREAARYGDVYRQATAKKHLADSVENYSRATKGYFDNLKNTDPGTYYALTMTPEEIDRELELLNNGAYLDSKITKSLTNDERIMGEYWHRTPQEQRQYEHNLERARFAGETDDERNAYISSEKEAYRDARNRMLNDASVEGSVGSNQEPYNRREEITQANEARKSILENARMTQKVIQAERDGITNDPQIIASGKQKFEKDQDAIWDRWTVEQGWAETSPKMDNLGRAHEHGYVLDRMDEMTEEQRARIYSLYDRDPETALKLAQTYAKALDDKVYQEIFDWVAKDSGWQFGRRAVGNLVGAVINLTSGLDPFGYGGQSAGKIGDALIGGAAQSATRNGWFGIEELGGDRSPISSSVPFVGRGRAGEASQLVSSMEQSALTTLPAMIAGRYDAAAASWLETAGLLLQSSSAARSDYRESIEAGLDDTTAKIHAVAAGIAEYTFEKVSFDKLLAQNTSRMTFKKVMKDVLVQAGIEGSEELHTTLANTIMDEIISGDGKSKVDRRIAELVQGGMSMKEAKGVAEKEWLTGIVNDFIGGAASGGFMTGAHYAVGATVNTAENKIANNAVNQLVGQYAGAQTENFTDADTIEAAKNYAEARGIDASGLTEAADKARNASVDEAMSALRGSTQSESETKSISKRDSRKAGKAWTEIRTQISQDFDGKSGAQAAQLYDQMAEQYGAGIKTIVDEVVTTQARQSYLEQSQTAQELQQNIRPKIEALPEGGYKQASMRAYDQAEYQLRQQESARTADRLAKAGNIDTEVTYTNKDGSETTAQIAELSDDLTSVVLDNGETVPIKDVQMSADTASAIRIFSRIAGKKAASLAFREYRAYLNNGGTEGYRFAEAVATAYGQGLNGVLTAEQALKMAPDFAQEAAERAFSAGRSKHQANIENEQARRKAAEEKAKAEGAQTVKGELRGVDSIKWEKMNATRRTRAQNQIKYLDSIAQGIGVDIELFQSEATRRGKRMAYRGEQGAWYVDKATGKPVIRIDVNAGANFISDLNAALIATTGHELAHHFQHISPAVYDEYRQAVVQAILSTENGYEKLQRLIEHEKRINRRADGTTISTDEAIDEVVADASRDRVGDRNLWKNVADSMSDESRGKVAQWLHDRFSKILKLTKRYAGFEAADLVLQSAQEYQDLIGELWQKLATQAANAVDVREGDYPAPNDVNTEAETQEVYTERYSSRVEDQETLDFLNGQEYVTVYRAMQMVDGKLYSPMAAKVNGSWGTPIELGVWEQTDEHPELAVKDKKGNWSFKLDKGNGSSIYARYNPYIHTSLSVLNDQFSSAYKRPNLVVVECRIPKSELTSGYKAEKAKDAVGQMEWHSGPVSSKLQNKRQVILTRWDMPVRVLSDEEVAAKVKTMLEGENVEIPWKVVTPGLYDALKNEGVKVQAKENPAQRYAARSVEETDAEYLELAKDPEKNADRLQEMVDEAAKRAGFTSPMLFHGTNAFGFTTIKTSKDVHADGFSFWAANKESAAGTYTRYGKTREINSEIDYEETEEAIEKRSADVDEAIDDFRYLIDRTFSEWFYGQYGNEYIRRGVDDSNPVPGSGDGVYDFLVDQVADAFNEYSDSLSETYEDFADFQERSKEWEKIEDAIVAIEGAYSALSEIQSEGLVGGIYELYANTDNMYVVDAKGAAWNALHPEGLPKIERGEYKNIPYKTRDVANWARDNGYDGVIFKNIKDNGAYGRTESFDVYAFFNPQAQIKSADPITYDDQGNVIPLSERFNAKNEDIRYSEREDQSLRGRVSELEDQLDMAELNGLSQAEIRKLNNELIKARGQLDTYAANQRRQAKRTSFNEILRNLENYERVDLESLAEQISDSAWDDYDELSDEELIDALRETINERLEDFAPGEADDPKYGLFVKKPKTAGNISVVRYSDRDTEYLELAKDPEKNADRLQEMVDEAAKRAGYTIKAWHGTPIKGFTSFDSRKIGSTTDNGLYGRGFYFSTNKVTADLYATAEGETMPVYLNAQNPWWTVAYKDKAKVAEMLDMDENALTIARSGISSKVVVPSGSQAAQFTSHLVDHGYDSIIIQHGSGNYEIVVFNPEKIKSADPITYDDQGNVIPLSERFRTDRTGDEEWKNDDIRYSQRDYGQVSDLDVVESLDEKKATTPEAKALIREAKEKAEKIRKLEQKLSELRGELKTTDRALNTRGITKLSSDMLKRMSMSNDYYENLSGWLSGKITEVYQNALDHMDRTGSVRAAGDALYNGAQEIADFLMQNAGYHENIGGKWQRARWASQFAQNEEQRQAVMNDVFASLIRDWSENRNRAPMHETEADRIAQRATRPVQKKLDETRAKLETARAENAEMAEKNASLTRDYESSRDYASYLRDYAKSLMKQLNDAEKAVKLAGKTTQKQEQKIADLKRKLHDALQAKKAMENAKQRAERAGERTASRLQRQLEAQIEREQRIMEGKLKPLAIQRMLAEARDTATAKARAQAQERFANQKENRKRGELRERIVRHAGDLEQKLLKPSDKRHIPEQYRLATTALLNAINRESGFDYDPNTLHTTSRGATVGKRVEKGEGTATKRTQAFLALKEALQRIAAEDGFTGELLDFDGDGSGLISQALALGDVPISRMNMEQLGTIWQTVRALEHNITNFNRAFAAGRAETISGIADKFRTDTEGRKPRQRDAKNALDAKQMKLFAMTKYLENPYTFFDHYGESGHEMFRRLRDAQDLIQVRGDYIAEVWLGEMRNALGVTGTDEKVRKAVEDFVEKTDKAVEVFTLQSGQKLTLTHSMMMDVWLLSQREPTGLNHLLGSGVIQPKIDVKGHYTTRDATFRHLTIEDIQEIGSRLTEQEKATARAMQVVQRQLAKWGNEASMTVYGYRKFTEDNYWPVKNAREENKSESGQDNGRQATGTMNKGMARNLKPNAATGTEPVSAFRQLQGSISDMLTYSTWGPTLEDMNRVFNYKYKDESGATVTTVKSLVDQYGGEGSQRYWADLAKHISVGIGSSDNAIAAAIGKGVGAVKGARVAFNARVVIQQPTAYSRAAEVIDHKYLIASLGDLKSWSPGAKSAWNRALKYSPTARRKDSTTYDMGGSIRNDKALGLEKASAVEKFTDVGTALAGKADALTWGRLWHAAELQISAKTDLEKGSDEYYDAVNKLFTEAVDRTQVMDGILQRPAIMRMNSDFVKGMTAYMGEPLMQVNMLMRQAASWKQVGWKVAKKAMFRTASGLLLSQLINAMVQSVFDATFRRTDEDKDWWERFLAEMSGIDGTEKSAFDRITGVLLGGNLASELGYLNKIPGINDLLSLIEGYDPGNDRFDLAAAKDLINAVKLLSNDKYTGWHKAKELVSKMTMLFGVGVGNALRDIYGAAHNFVFDNLGPRAKFDFKAIWLNPESKQNRRQYFDLLWQMLETGDKKGFKAYAERLSGGGGDALMKFVSGEAQDRYENGTIDAETFSDMMEAAGADGEYIEGRFYNSIRELHEKKLATDEEAYELLQKWAGKDSKEAWDIVRKWNAKEAFSGDPDDFKWSQYDDLYAAIAEDGDILGVVREYKEKGYTDKQVNDNTKDGIRAALKGGSITENEAIDLLTRYVTYTKDGQAVAFDKDKAWKTVQEWQAKAENDGDPDYSYNQYDELFSAIDANKDVNGIVSELTAHGYDKDDVTKAVKGHLIDNYVAGKASETALKNQLSRYCGIVKTDEVSEIVNSANCKKTTGYYPDSLKDGYVDGKLSKDNVISALKVYKGLDSTSASNRVRAWDFQKEHPDLKWDSDRVDAYYDKRPEGGGKSAYEAGISVETYDDYRNRAAKAKGVDANGDGKTDSGSKKAEILRIIDSLDLSRSQKDALYYINGWAASTIYEAPWH